MKNDGENKKESTVILNEGDCAIVFRTTGQCELCLPTHTEEDDISPLELLAAGLTMFLRDPKFVEMIKSEFIKNLQKGEKIIDERTDAVPKTEPPKKPEAK